MKYKVMKTQKYWAWGLFFASHLGGIGISLHRAISYVAVSDGPFYVIHSDLEFERSVLGRIWATTRIVSSFVGGAVLVGLTVMLIRQYRKEHRKHKALMSGALNANNVSEPIDEKSLRWLLLAQLLMTDLGLLSRLVHITDVHILGPAGPQWCEKGFMYFLHIKLVFTTFQIVMNFFIYIGVSRTFRKAVIGVLTRKVETTTVGVAQA
ncbi:MAG: hypothetical protein GY696_32320 [Gammaproteobacteria bacterium]|nr:hypothetical protein [Gammaproteobacteria bacterium]